MPADIRAALAQQRRCEADAISDADVQDERRWRKGRSLATFCTCRRVQSSRYSGTACDASTCFMHTHVKDYLYSPEDICRDDKLSDAACLEFQRLRAEADEQGKVIGMVVADVDEQLQPILPLRLRTRMRERPPPRPPPALPPPAVVTRSGPLPLAYWPTADELAAMISAPPATEQPLPSPPIAQPLADIESASLPPGPRCTAITAEGTRCRVTGGHARIGAPLLRGESYCKEHMRRLPYRNPRPIPASGPGRPAPADRCSKCKQLGHWRAHCANAWVPGPCNICGEMGHFAYACSHQ